jgi:CBS domain-containing protein
MNVGQIMTRDPQTCRASDPMTRAAQIMWDADCGCVPIVDDDGKPIAVITDRDVCMAAYTRGLPLSTMSVASAASSRVISVRGRGDRDRRTADARIPRPPASLSSARTGVLSESSR